MVSNNPEESSCHSRQDTTRTNATVFNDEHVSQDGTIQMLDKCTRYKRQFERVLLHSYDHCYPIENKPISVTRRSQ